MGHISVPGEPALWRQLRAKFRGSPATQRLGCVTLGTWINPFAAASLNRTGVSPHRGTCSTAPRWSALCGPRGCGYHCGGSLGWLRAGHFGPYLRVPPWLREVGLQKGKLRLGGATFRVTHLGNDWAGFESSSVCYALLASRCHLPLSRAWRGWIYLQRAALGALHVLLPQHPPGSPPCDGWVCNVFLQGAAAARVLPQPRCCQGLLLLLPSLPSTFPRGPSMLQLPGPAFSLLPHSLHSSRSFSQQLGGGSAPL